MKKPDRFDTLVEESVFSYCLLDWHKKDLAKLLRDEHRALVTLIKQHTHGFEDTDGWVSTGALLAAMAKRAK